MKPAKTTERDLIAENEALSQQLAEAQETLSAIHHGEVDALVVSTPEGLKTYTLTGAEKPYRLLIEEMSEGAVMLSDDNSILYCNKGFSDLVQIPLDKIIGSRIENLVAQTHVKDFQKLLFAGRAGKGATAKEITFQASKNSLSIPTYTSINSIKTETQTTTFIVVTDLRKHMEEEVKRYTAELEKTSYALWESEQRWATTLASIGDAVIATDLQGKITFMNKVAEELTGWSRQGANQKPVKQVFKIINEQTRLEAENPIAKVLKKGMIVGLANKTTLIKKDGTEISIDDSGAPIKDKDGKMTGVVLIFRDITEKRKAENDLKKAVIKSKKYAKQLERTQAKLEEKAAEVEEYATNMEALAQQRAVQLKDAERLATIGTTAGMVGHDIRNPLQSITSDLYLVKMDLIDLPASEQKTAIVESIHSIEASVDYVNKIVQDLQDFARPLQVSLQTVDLKGLCAEVLANHSIHENITTMCHVDEAIQKTNSDPSMLKRILMNLVNNAVQAMPKGGKLSIDAKAEKDNIVISVADTGVGIPEETKPKLFTPLMTTKAKGQGFGLAVVKRMTEALGGTVTFESQVGKGTTFTVTLPLKT